MKTPHRPAPDKRFALGVRGGTLLSSFPDGTSYGDLGMGLVGQFRPAPALGLELAVQHHQEDWTASQRTQTLGSGSGLLYLFPKGNLSPYGLAGLTFNARDISSRAAEFDGVPSANLSGLHYGGGLEIDLLPSISLDLEGRKIDWFSQDALDPSGTSSWQANAGLLVHF